MNITCYFVDFSMYFKLQKCIINTVLNLKFIHIKIDNIIKQNERKPLKEIFIKPCSLKYISTRIRETD